jgi:hypothetical protein
MEEKMKNDDHKEPPGQNKEITIIINAREYTVTGKQISFTDVVKLAFNIPSLEENKTYTVTYKKGEDKKPAGNLVLGEDVHVKDGMIFNVTATDKS